MNDFSRQDIETLKASVDLCELMRSHGIELKPVGRNFTAICPWHDDREASLVVNPERQLYNCFGCDAKGDALSFLQAQEQISFPQAVMRLKEVAGDTSQAPPSESPKPSDPDRFTGGHTRTDLLDKVCQHYQNGLEGSEEARQYLKDRKLWNSELYEGFQFGYCDGTLLKALPKGDVRDALHEIGILNSKGREHFLGCVVVPLFHPTDGLVGFYGRRLNPKSKVRHLFLPGPKRGVLGHQSFGESKFVYVAEGVLDALSLWSAGLRPVTCSFGTAGLPDELEKHLRASSVTEMRLCFDSDQAGDKAVETLCEQAGDRFKLSQILLPAGVDPNDVLVREGPDVLQSFAQCLKPLVEPSELAPTKHLPLTETTDTGFRLTFEEPPVVYLVTPQPPYNSSRLKVTLRAKRRAPNGDNPRSAGRPLKYLDRCDLISSRSRSETLRGISQKLSLDKETAELHLGFILDTSEEFCLAGGELGLGDGGSGISGEAPALTESEKLEALEFLQAPDLVQRLQDNMEELGYVGEERSKLLLYLVGVSRKLENPMSSIIRSQSGAGKSGLANLITSLVPPEDVIHYSRVSAHALAYAGKDVFKHKLLSMEERIGGEAADYYIRVLQSSHKIRQAVTITDPGTGQMRMEEFEVEGPIAYIETTTVSHLNQENANRCFEIYLDESEEQTRRIHERQRMSREALRLKRLNKDTICARHHNAQRMLKEIPIVIPYVRHLTFPTRWLRTRRDNERFLCLIEASAFLHQHQRKRNSCRGPDGNEVTYVEANLDDYRLAYDLAKDVLRDTLHELSISARELLDAAGKLEGAFTRRELRNVIGWSQRRIHEGIHELVDMEYLAGVSGSNGRAHQYTVVLNGGERPSPVVSLLHPDALAQKLADPVP